MTEEIPEGNPDIANGAIIDFIGYPTAQKAIMKRVMTPLCNLPWVSHNYYINVLVVLVGPRIDARKTRKKDYYVQEASSLVVSGRRRKTVLSVWRDQEAFDAVAKPGSIVAVYGAAVNKNYEEDVVNKVMKLASPKAIHGHLNIYSSCPRGWYIFEPLVGLQGYKELVAWRDAVVTNELALQEELLKRRMRKDEEERERADKEFKDAEVEKLLEMKERAKIGETEAKKREKFKEEKEEDEVRRLDAEGMIWWRDRKPLWKVDGLY